MRNELMPGRRSHEADTRRKQAEIAASFAQRHDEVVSPGEMGDVYRCQRLHCCDEMASSCHDDKRRQAAELAQNSTKHRRVMALNRRRRPKVTTRSVIAAADDSGLSASKLSVSRCKWRKRPARAQIASRGIDFEAAVPSER